MKALLIFSVAVAFLIQAKAVENPAIAVENPTEYDCSNIDNNSFKLIEHESTAQIAGFQGENLYEDGQLKLVTKQHGFMSTKTTFEFASGATLVISERVPVGRGGGRGGRGGFDFPLNKIISAKLTSNEKDHYFNCN